MKRLSLVLSLAFIAACPRAYDPGGTGHFPTNGKPAARSRFESARARFEQADYRAAEREAAAVVREFPDDPIAPYASLYAGMAELRQGQWEAAERDLRQVADAPGSAPELQSRARFFLGLATLQLGRAQEARTLLEPFRGRITEGDDAGELHAALAEAAVQEHDLPLAILEYDVFYTHARPAEKAYIVARVSALVDRLPENVAAQTFERTNRRGPGTAFLARKLAAQARAAGNPERARQLVADSAAARAEIGLEEAASAAAVSANLDPQVVGAVLPLSGKRRLVGEAAQRGMALAAGTYDRAGGGGLVEEGVPRPFTVAIEDGGEGKGRAGAAVDALAAAGVIAVVGPADPGAVEEAAARAELHGVALVTLDVSDAPLPAGASHVFRVVVSVEARAQALAGYGRGQGAKRFAILQPQIPYGARAAAAFQREVEAQGGVVVANITYARDATSFVEPVGRLARHDFDAVFIPDTAARLELIAPQLAVADLVVQPRTAKRPKRGRAVLLLSTAEALSPKFLRGSGRYTAGAGFAPGFYPDEQDRRIGAYVMRYKAAYGDDPTYLDAYAWDAALAVRAAVEQGAADREAVTHALAAFGPRTAVRGLTGDIYFDGSRERGDRGVIYVVAGDGAAIRAARK